ncbi:MAG: porin PorA family protein [Dehalococcoidia bacterium]|nr:porin PorA family protein [Dehalococcoidia bacterium]
MRRKIGVALCVLGLFLAVFGIVWITVIWPTLAKVPADLDQATSQQGTVTLYDAAHNAYVTYDVINSRHYVAVAATTNIVYLEETITFTDTSTDQEIPSLRAKYHLGIDRVTRQNVEGRGDGIGGGHYSFPFGVDKDTVYQFWNEGNPANIECTYVGETKFEGLRVYVFEMATPDEGLTTPAGFVLPDLREYQPAMRIDQKITLYVEPVSGVTVYFEGTTRRSGTIPIPDELFPVTGPVTNTPVVFYEDNLSFTDATVQDLVGQAKSAKTQVTLAKNLLPWLSIGSGIVLIIVGTFLALKPNRPAPVTPAKEATGGEQST